MMSFTAPVPTMTSSFSLGKQFSVLVLETRRFSTRGLIVGRRQKPDRLSADVITG